MVSSTDPLHREFQRVACHELDRGLVKIEHCVDQLSDADVWSRATDQMNSVGNILLHLNGNLRQWIVSGVGGAPDVRQRPREFAQRDPIPKSKLLADLRQTIDEAKAAIQRSTGEDLLRNRHVQHDDVTGVFAAFSSINHFVGHVQEITYMTRMRLGEKYRFLGIGAGSV